MAGMNMEINKRGVFLTVIILASICYILYSNGDETNPDIGVQGDAQPVKDGEEIIFEVPNIADEEDEDAYPEIGLEVEYVEDFVNVDGINVFYMYANSTIKGKKPPKFPVLMLHGMAFQAETWKSIGTLQFLATAGYFPIAIDLPGFGKTKSEKFHGDVTVFMEKLIQALPHTNRPVIISPSMSGRFSLPYLFKHQSDVRGFIPVAPVNHYEEKDYAKLRVPALIVYGEQDTSGKKTSEIIHNIPKSKLEEIPNGAHPAYLTDPALFHSKVKDFLDTLK